MINSTALLRYSVLFLCILIMRQTVFSQEPEKDTHLYRPANMRDNASIEDTISRGVTTDSLSVRDIAVQDSIRAREQFVQDSIAKRMQFIQDSILAREIFVRDSIARRKRILDSLHFLQNNLPVLVEATIRAHNDDLILQFSRIEIIGDSMLSPIHIMSAPFALDKPYRPWENTIPLSDGNLELDIDTVAGKINSINSRKLVASFSYNKRRDIFVIASKSSIVNRRSGRVYKVPVDSVFLDQQGNIQKIKRYEIYHEATANYRMGNKLYSHLSQVKQYNFSGRELNGVETVNFCERESASAPKKVCNIVRFKISRSGNTYTMVRSQEPANAYADGAFTFEYDANGTLKSVAFVNNKKTEDWKTFVETNEEGLVSSYVYQKQGWVHQTLVINYYLDDPNAKHKVETISCTFEDDGISYFQTNNMTGKSRRRDHFTGEWGPWE